MRSYDKYKDSEIFWLPAIPDHWSIDRIKDVAETQSGTTPTSSNRLYYEGGEYNWIRTTDLNDGELFEVEYKVTDLALKECRLKFLPVDTLLVAMYGGFGTIGKNSILKKESTINQSVCAILPTRHFNPNYVLYFLKYFRNDWKLFADGTRKDPNINQDAVRNLFFINPPLEEQTAIAEYLDTKTQAIDKKVSLLEKKIGYYQELRKSLINETVTKGLDKNVKLKDSGIDWIGQIPEHWEVKRLKDIAAMIGSGTTPTSSIRSYYENGNVNWLNTGDLNDGYITQTKYKITEEALEAYPNMKLFKKGTLVFALYGATIGKLGLLEIETTSNQACCCMSFPKSKIDPRYIFYWFLINKENIISLSVGGTQPNVSQGILCFLKMTVPPLLEQVQIADYLTEKTSKIEQIITNIQTQITTLKELRKTLINDVVTGKIKV